MKYYTFHFFPSQNSKNLLLP